MDVILKMLAGGEYDPLRAVAAAFVLLIVPTLYFFIARARAIARAGRPFALRPLPAIDGLRLALERSAESGRPVHFSAGTGSIGDASTTQSMAALLLLDQIAQKAASYDIHPLVTASAPTLMIAAQDRVRHAYAQRGLSEHFEPSSVRLLAPERVAYAAGVMDILNREPLSGNVMLGAFGDEFLLMGEAGAARGVEQVAGAAEVPVLPFVYATTKNMILGEDIFAAGAYLGRLPSLVGSLFAQDWIRVLIVAMIILGVTLKSIL